MGQWNELCWAGPTWKIKKNKKNENIYSTRIVIKFIIWEFALVSNVRFLQIKVCYASLISLKITASR